MTFLSEAHACLTLAPALLTWMARVRSLRQASIPRLIEAALIGVGLAAVTFRVFHWPTAGPGAIPALVYLPMPCCSGRRCALARSAPIHAS